MIRRLRRWVMEVPEVKEFVHDLLAKDLGHQIVPDPKLDEDGDVNGNDDVNRIVLVLDDRVDRGLEGEEPDDERDDVVGAEAMEKETAHDIGRNMATKDEIVASTTCFDLVKGHENDDLPERSLAREGSAVLVATTIDVAVGKDCARVRDDAQQTHERAA